MFIPRFNAPDEQTAYLKWVRERLLELIAENEALRAELGRLAGAGNTNSSQTNTINSQVRDLSLLVGGFNGLPPDGVDDWVIKWDSGAAVWEPNTVGGLPPEYLSITPADGGVELAGLAEAKAINVILNPTMDGDSFELGFPFMYDGETGLDLPFFVLTVASIGFSSEVDVSGSGPVPTYSGKPDVPLNGSDTLWTLPADFYGAWFILPSYDSGRMVAIPIYDTYYATEHGNTVNIGAEPAATTTADAGTGATATVTGTGLAGEVELVTGTSPTGTGWAELLTFTGGWASGESPVLHLAPANEDAAGLSYYSTRSGVETQAWFDMTGVAASTTYLFHYSLLPAA